MPHARCIHICILHLSQLEIYKSVFISNNHPCMVRYTCGLIVILFSTLRYISSIVYDEIRKQNGRELHQCGAKESMLPSCEHGPDEVM